MFNLNCAVLVMAQVCNTCSQISSNEWMSTFMSCDRLANEVTRVFDDLRHKFTANIKAEFLVERFYLIRCALMTRQAIVQVPLQDLPTTNGEPKVCLRERLGSEMRILMANLMCHNLRCTLSTPKPATWRMTFSPKSHGAIAFVLAQVRIPLSIYF